MLQNPSSPATSRILVVDDDRLVREELIHRLTSMGYALAGAVASGEEALRQAAQNPPDLVLMDITLEGDLDGLEAARQLRRQSSTPPPVVFLTADDSWETIRQAKNSLPYGYLIKPIVPAQLRSSVEIALGKAAVEAELAASQECHREAEERYQSIFLNAPLGIFRADAQGRLHGANPALASVLGYDDVGDLLTTVQRLDLQVFAEEDEFAKLLKILRTTPEVRDYEAPMYGKDGDELWVSLNARQVPGQEVPALYDFILEDITEQVDAQQAFQAAFQLLSTAIDAISDIILVTDLDGSVVLANAAASQALTVPIDDLKGRNFREFLSSPGNRASSSLILQGPGGRRYLENATPFDDPSGNTIGAVRVLRDVETLRQECTTQVLTLESLR